MVKSILKGYQNMLLRTVEMRSNVDSDKADSRRAGMALKAVSWHEYSIPVSLGARRSRFLKTSLA